MRSEVTSTVRKNVLQEFFLRKLVEPCKIYAAEWLVISNRYGDLSNLTPKVGIF